MDISCGKQKKLWYCKINLTWWGTYRPNDTSAVPSPGASFLAWFGKEASAKREWLVTKRKGPRPNFNERETSGYAWQIHQHSSLLSIFFDTIFLGTRTLQQKNFENWDDKDYKSFFPGHELVGTNIRGSHIPRLLCLYQKMSQLLFIFLTF